MDEDPFIVVPLNPLRYEPDPVKVRQEKQFIRDNILGKTNEELVANKKAMEELQALGSDLNINAFACNFRINGKVNTDVEEANYLNQCIFAEFSVTDNDTAPSTMQLFLSATVFEREDYGECADEFKRYVVMFWRVYGILMWPARRLGLETVSKQPLFVLRNVVMSPFPTERSFIRELAQIFYDRVEAETEVRCVFI